MVTIAPEPTDSHTDATLAAENQRLRDCLQHIYDDHARQTATWQHRSLTKSAGDWHNGYVTACATHAIQAKKALNPEAAEEDERMLRLGAEGTDADWYRATGHCGGCGVVASNCGCEGKCGCFKQHGPRKEPYLSPAQRAERAEAQRDQFAAWLRDLTEAEWDNPCRLDHNGDCQEHGQFGGACSIPLIAAALEPEPTLDFGVA